MTSAASRMQPQDSRDEILKAAIQLFAKRGFHETSMSEVAKEAHVSKALIFWHFKAKEELFLAVLNRLLEPYYIDFAEESEQLNEREQLRRLIDGYVRFVRDNAGSVSFFLRRVLNGEAMPDAFTSQIRQLYNGYQSLITDRIREGQAKGLCAGSHPPAVMTTFVLSALNGFLINLLFVNNPQFNLDGALEVLWGLLFNDCENPRSEGAAPEISNR